MESNRLGIDQSERRLQPPGSARRGLRVWVSRAACTYRSQPPREYFWALRVFPSKMCVIRLKAAKWRRGDGSRFFCQLSSLERSSSESCHRIALSIGVGTWKKAATTRVFPAWTRSTGSQWRYKGGRSSNRCWGGSARPRTMGVWIPFSR